jgi:hypothetical protein
MKRTTQSQIGLAICAVGLIVSGILNTATGSKIAEAGVIASLTFAVYFIIEYYIVASSKKEDSE